MSDQITGEDIQEMLDKCIEFLRPMLQQTRDHFYQSEQPSKCSVTVEFKYNKEGEVVIKTIPASVLPREPDERTGEFSGDGSLHLI